MNDVKLWYQSKTIWGALVAILAGVLQMSGVDIDADGQEQFSDGLVALSGAVGGLVALYGRLCAEKKVG
jgi:hypothetical protein